MGQQADLHITCAKSHCKQIIIVVDHIVHQCEQYTFHSKIAALPAG